MATHHVVWALTEYIAFLNTLYPARPGTDNLQTPRKITHTNCESIRRNDIFGIFSTVYSSNVWGCRCVGFLDCKLHQTWNHWIIIYPPLSSQLTKNSEKPSFLSCMWLVTAQSRSQCDHLSLFLSMTIWCWDPFKMCTLRTWILLSLKWGRPYCFARRIVVIALKNLA